MEYKLSLKVKDCNVVFKDGFEPGVLVTEVVTLSEDLSVTQMAVALADEEDAMLKRYIDVTISRVKENHD